MKWAEYSTVYTGVLDSITLRRENITYIECMYSVLDGLSEWWMFCDESPRDMMRNLDALTVQ